MPLGCGTPPRIRKNAKTKLEAKQIEAGLVQKMRRGPLNLTTLTVHQYADAWLDRLPTYDLQPRTIGGYRQVLRQHVLPQVGRMVIQKITVPTVKELLATLSGQYAKNTIKNVKIAFSAMLSEAGFPDAAKALDQEMVGAASEAIIAHLEEQGDLIAKAIDEGLIAA